MIGTKIYDGIVYVYITIVKANSIKDDLNKIRGIRIAIPDDVIKSIVIMKGPRVQEDSEEWKKLIELLNKEGLNHPTESIFKGKLQNMACDRCKPNQEYRKAHRNSLK